jgi:folate-binding protein YgfZ
VGPGSDPGPHGVLGFDEQVTTDHYGDPYREQRQLAAGAGAVDLSDRPVLRITGPDRLSWLHTLVSQHVAALQPGESAEALVLSPSGHVEHHLHLLEDGEQVLAHVEPGTADALIAFLDSMRFMLRVEVSIADDLTTRWQLTDVAGLATRTGFGSYSLHPKGAGYDGELAGFQAFEALRVEAMRPRSGVDTDHRTLPQEVGWLGTAVHLDKGCYRGQESVARVHNLGRPPRRLVLLHLDGSDSELPETGSPVELAGRPVGRLGTSVRHYELGPIALALVKRQVPDDAQLVVGGVTASIDPSRAPVVPESPARAAAEARAGLLRFRPGS